jgi:hypothetical protein
MQEHFAFGGIRALPGQKATGFFHIPGTSVSMPLTVINGVATGPTLLVTAGIHGGEYPSTPSHMFVYRIRMAMARRGRWPWYIHRRRSRCAWKSGRRSQPCSAGLGRHHRAWPSERPPSCWPIKAGRPMA